MKYPKIETLYNRDTEGNWGVIPGDLRCPEFALVKEWLITEKVDGRNHRVILHPDGTIEHRGRTDRAQFANFMLEGIHEVLDHNLVREAITPDEDGQYPLTIFYGELYGPKIQGGGKYTDHINFRLFDVRIGDWWMEWENVCGFAAMLNVNTVPVLRHASEWLPESKPELQLFFTGHAVYGSDVTMEEKGQVGAEPEGIVARTVPTLFNRKGERVMYKLKFKDFK